MMKSMPTMLKAEPELLEERIQYSDTLRMLGVLYFLAPSNSFTPGRYQKAGSQTALLSPSKPA